MAYGHVVSWEQSFGIVPLFFIQITQGLTMHTVKVDIRHMVGKTFVAVDRSSDDTELKFVLEDGSYYHMYHEPDCCESVTIEDICGDLSDLIGTPVLIAEDVSSNHEVYAMIRPIKSDLFHDDSETWTYYKIDTCKGGVTIRWFGTSNGYYSEDVSLFYTSPSRSH